MDKEKAIKVLAHLQKNNLAFCFVDGVVIDADACNRIILTPEEYKQMKAYNNK